MVAPSAALARLAIPLDVGATPDKSVRLHGIGQRGRLMHFAKFAFERVATAFYCHNLYTLQQSLAICD